MDDAGRLILDHYREAAEQDVGENAYRGLRIHAWFGIHEAVGAVAARTLKPGSQVLDLASGTGAMCLRLKDLGMNPTGCDLVNENFRLHDTVPFRMLNLNQSLPSDLAERFDAITATEIIEHLENPRHFLRQCAYALKPGGHLILTSPNVDSALSRAIWIRTGSFKWFGQREYQTDGHIMPVPLMVLRRALGEAGFEILEEASVGHQKGSFWSWWKMYALAALLRALDSCRSPQAEMLMLLARKSEVRNS